jgi:hypothetical protein
MSRPVAGLVGAFVTLCLLVAAGPTVVGLVNALPAVVLALGLAVSLLRLVWHVTRDRSS